MVGRGKYASPNHSVSGSNAGKGYAGHYVCASGRDARMRSGNMTARLMCWVVMATFGVAASSLSRPERASADSCTNMQFRVGYSAQLPDCRAYELVTPPGSAAPIAPLYLEGFTIGVSFAPEGSLQAQAAVNGEAIAYGSEEGSAQSPGPVDLSRRGSEGWSTEGVIPSLSAEPGLCVDGNVIADWSESLSEGVLEIDHQGNPEAECATDEPPLVTGEPRGITNLFVRDASAEYELVDVTPLGVVPVEGRVTFDGASADLRVVVFDEEAALTHDAQAGDNLYEWSGGKVHLVTVRPGGKDEPISGVLAGSYGTSIGAEGNESAQHPVSRNGSRVFFQANGNLYVRENGGQDPVGECTAGSACTLEIDEKQGGVESGGGVFAWASADGSKVFFTDERKLTKDSTAKAGEPDLYEYKVDSEAGKPGTLTDLTVSSAGAANVLGVSGASEDGSYVYFVADGVLASNKSRFVNAEGQVVEEGGAKTGEPNLYVRHEDQTDFIATLSDAATVNGGDVCDWTPVCLTARVSSNGKFVAFDSTASLTGYDNAPALAKGCEYAFNVYLYPGAPCVEIFRYATEATLLECASCGRGALKPVAATTIRTPGRTFDFSVPSAYVAHNMSNSGQVFFDSANALVSGSSNGLRNVYEFDDRGLHLLSSGTAGAESFFYDATPDGSDAFFITEQALVPTDTSAKYAIYDARVDGGFPYAQHAPACEGVACKGAVTAAPALIAPGSADFSGTGNRHVTTGRLKPRRLTRKERLARALKACKRRKGRRRRQVCERKARQRNAVTTRGLRHVSMRGSK